MCCTSRAKIGEIGEKVISKYISIKVGMLIFKDDMVAIGDTGTIRTEQETAETEKKNTI